jgi:hypothetical protein
MVRQPSASGAPAPRSSRTLAIALRCSSSSGTGPRLVSVDDRPFVVVIGPESPDDLDELLHAGLAQVLGWTPRGILTLVAMCDQVADHRLLGELCLRFATQLGGIVSFGGSLPGRGVLPRDRPSAPLREDSVEGLAGTLFTLSYPTADHEYATAHLGDAELLRAWLTHPHFRMVK